VYLRAFVQGWAESELIKFIPNFTCAEVIGVAYDSMLEVAIRHAPGVHTSLEVHVRTFYRTMFLDAHSDIDDQAFWIRWLLADRPLEDRAKLLFLLYGPLNFSNACVIRFDSMLTTDIGNGYENAPDHEAITPKCRCKVARLDESQNIKPSAKGDSECICATGREQTSSTKRGFESNRHSNYFKMIYSVFYQLYTYIAIIEVKIFCVITLIYSTCK
jgi:hypothetical protein